MTTNSFDNMATASRPSTKDGESQISTIADAADKAKKLLSFCAKVDDDETKSFARDQLGRFNLWASNINVFAAPLASLDYRLRPVPIIAVAIRGNLEILCRRSLEMLKPGEDTIDDDLQILCTKPLDEVCDWLQTVIPQYLPGHLVSPKARDKIASNARKKIVSTITALHQLSLTIREATAQGSLEQHFDFLLNNASAHSGSEEYSRESTAFQNSFSTNSNLFGFPQQATSKTLHRRSLNREYSVEDVYNTNLFTRPQANDKADATTNASFGASIEPEMGQSSGYSNLDRSRYHDAGHRPHPQMTLQHLQNFCAWADEHAVEGLTSDGKAARYLPYSAQYQYWTPTKVQEIIQSYDFVTSSKEISDYICIFSTLVSMEAKGMSALHYLDEIMRGDHNDAKLPLAEDMTELHHIFGSVDNFRNFIDTQWMFCPMAAKPFLTTSSVMPTSVFLPNGRARFMDDHRVHVKQIFPVTKDLESPVVTSHARRRATVSHMKIHSTSSAQQPKTGPNIVVFETYPPEEERTYDELCRGYAAIEGISGSNAILQYLGSFKYVTDGGHQFSTIILELADSGTLEDLFWGNKIPYQIGHVRAIWRSLLEALHGVAFLHNLNTRHGNLCFYHGLKPSNLFIFDTKDNKKPFRYTIKIGDFGSSQYRFAYSTIPDGNSMNEEATRTYGPPETNPGDTVDLEVQKSIDMWAFGCIMMELAVWITGGKLGLDDFQRHRIEETEALSQHEVLRRSDSFHDGRDALRAVQGVMQAIDENRRKHDYITISMVNLALDFVLVGKGERLHAVELISKMQRILIADSLRNPDIEDNFPKRPYSPTSPAIPFRSGSAVPHEASFPRRSPWSPDMTLTQRPPSEALPSPPVPSPPVLSLLSSPGLNDTHNSRPSPSGIEVPKNAAEPAMNRSFPIVSIDELKQWMVGKKNQNFRSLPGRDYAKALLDGRDFIFLLDNSRHTRKYRDEMKSGVKALTYLLKDIDCDGIEVASTSKPNAREKIKNQTQMSQYVEQILRGENSSDCMIETALDAILEPIKLKWSQRRSRFPMPFLRGQGSRDVTILIFTNGVWDHSSDKTCGAERPILSLIESMREHKIPRTQVSIQFVRLGSEERGIRRLRILDDELSDDFDIVDTKPITASIWNILIGTIQPAND